ncbi:actin-related protein 10-like [Ptychodera flava]|uniref:actin-related protein 10-like n=1 Tax=Ptychodera flava TaxID=63121 RepID=UPI00396A03E4
MTTKMPLFEGLGTAGEKTAVILDIGAAYTKIGFAGESSPRSIIPSEIKRSRTEKIDKVDIFAVDSEELYAILIDFLHHIYFRHLLVNPRDRRVVICESVLCPTLFRETLAQVLFRHYEVPSILFAPSHLVTLFTLGINSALVMDAGYTETLVLPVYEGTPIIKGWQALPLAAKAVHSNLEALLLENGTVTTQSAGHRPLSSIMSNVPPHILEDIKVRTCFVPELAKAKMIYESQMHGDSNKRPTPPPSVEYPLEGDKILHIDGKIRETSAEVLFDLDNDEQSVATLILDSILKCPLDMRKELASNVVCIGGTSLLPGFRQRLKAEILDMLNRPKYKEELPLTTIKFHNPPSVANYTAWFGGAIFGALEILAHRSVSRDAFLKHGRVPDWSSVDDLSQESEVIPKEKTTLPLSSLTRQLAKEK